MIYTDLPEKAKERKTIVFMEDYQLEITKLDKNNKWLDDPSVCVLEYPDEDISEDYPVLKNELYLKLKDKGLLNKNEPCVLVQYPYDVNDYTKPNENSLVDFIYNNAIEKYNIFKKLCASLGATRVVYESDKKESESVSEQGSSNISTNTDAKVGIKSFEGGGSYGTNSVFNSEINSKIKNTLSMKAESKFKGSDTPQIEKAKQLLEDKNLGSDTHLQSLIDLRSDEDMRIVEEKISLSMTSDSMMSLKTAAQLEKTISASLSFGFGLVKGEGNRETKEETTYSGTLESIQDISVIFLVEFGLG